MSTSIGYTSPINGSFTNIVNIAKQKNQRQPILGGGIKGFIAQPLIDTDNNNQFAQTRFTLRNSWNNSYSKQLERSKLKRVITPFRAVNNAGDILSRQYYSCNTGCQTFQSRPNMHGLSQRFGSQTLHCDGTLVPAGTCNVKYVYDSSNYSTYLKQQAILKTYNNLSNGGNEYNGSQVAWRAIRRY